MNVLRRHLLFIPESRKRPITESLLYKQIVRFFEQEHLEDKFEIRFLLIQNSKLPPAHFRSGKTWVKKEQIEKMAKNIASYLYKNGKKYDKKIAYVRGAYLEAIRLTRKNSGIIIEEVFTERQLKKLKKKGIHWMKVGLRMDEAFAIFRRRIKEIISDTKEKQLKLPL